MQFVRPMLSSEVLPTVSVEDMEDGQVVLVAGWPVAKQHPRGEGNTVFVTIEDEKGDLQLILWPQIFARHRRSLDGQVIIAMGVVSRWDGTTNVIVSDIERMDIGVAMPDSHDWH